MVADQWPPYIDNNAAHKGLAAELVIAALQRKGYQSNLRIDNWQRALEGVQIGIYDIACAIWKTTAREQDLLFSQPYLENKISFIKKKGLKVNYQHFTDLTDFIIGVQRGYAYDEAFMRSRALLKVPANHLIQNLQKLSQGSIDLTVGDQRAIKFSLQQFMPTHANEFEFLEPPLAQKKLYIAVSKTNPAAQTIINDFNLAIKEMQQDGSYAKILNQYP
ncbi:MAG: transporter substrate-binding domain-containing protein [Methyloprofundus sp.]|nr:transporter substrate-binding domain-containing protein [Methyloprofundus sp.]